MSKAIETAFAKFAVAFVAVAMLVALVAPAAQAQTTDDLQAMINDLLAQVAALQGQLGGGDSNMAAGICPGTVWTRSLSVGDTGADVMKLQQFLNADPETRVAASGVGSAGMETDYFGGLTGAAVAKFQTKYRAEILTPLGLVNATTYFGPSTMAQANALCAAASAVDDSSDDEDEDGMEDEDEDEDEDSSSLNGGESSLETFSMNDGDDTELREGQENAPVAEAEFDVEDGDVRIQRVDVAFNHISGAEDDPWDAFETVSLWVDGDMIAEMDVDDEDDWEEDIETGAASADDSDDAYRLRFTGLSQVFREGDEAVITVGVTVANNVLDTNETATWEVFVPTDGIRGRDGAGIDQYTGVTNDEVSFDIEEAGSDDELIVKSSSNDPESTTLQVEDNSKSDWLTIFIFDLDTDDSLNDIEVGDFILELDVNESNDLTATSTALYIDDARIMVDGDEVGDTSVTQNENAAGGAEVGTARIDVDVDNNEFEIDAGDRQEVELQVRFKALSTSDREGTTVTASIDSADMDAAEGADDVTPTGASTGDAHTLRTAGVILELVSTDETFVENNDTSTGDNEGSFELVFDVTAFEQDVYLEKTTDRSSTTANQAVNYQVLDNNGDEYLAGTVDAVLDSNADEEGSYYRVDEGETERFTLTVEFDPAAGGFYRVQLYSVNFNESAAAPNAAGGSTQRAIPASDFDTDSLSI